MLAREKWQVKTIKVLERVFEERVRQEARYGHRNRTLKDGTGPDVPWLNPVVDVARSAYTGPFTAKVIQEVLREGYEEYETEYGEPTRMHLVLEEVAEAFELNADSPEFVDEILQVAALCVQWAEEKM